MSKLTYKGEDLFVLIFIASLIFSGFINPNAKTVNYIGAYFLIFIFEYLILKGAIYKNININELLKVNMIAIIFLGIFIILEFSLNYYLGINIQDFLPRSRMNTAIYGGIFPRSYGFATEPGVAAFYFNTLGPIGLWYLWKKERIKKYKKLILSIIVTVAFITTFSSAGIVFFILSFLIVSLLNLHRISRKKIRLKRVINLIPILLFIMITLAFNLEIINKFEAFINPILSKMSLNTQVGSVSDRLSRWERGLDSIKDKPIFGSGLGSTTLSGYGSSTNWYMFLTVETGLIGILPVLIFLVLIFIRLMKSKNESRNIYLFSFIAGILHFSVISTFYHPFLWLLIIIFYFDNDSYKRRKKCENMNVL
ncbi:O-antigen ligase family protein [Phosphitispora sp. TUW77]|uniref:O-antigen ligase family protein n=1 Tax=Phosphitispora sp. TUW77 TaxID=3152361 RepID=UPI003AB48033